MRLPQLRSIKSFRSNRFFKLTKSKQMKFPSIFRSSRNYLKITFPLSLFGLAYAVSLFSQTVHQQQSDSVEKRFQDLIEGTERDQNILEKLEEIFEQTLNNFKTIILAFSYEKNEEKKDIAEKFTQLSKFLEAKSDKICELIQKRQSYRDGIRTILEKSEIGQQDSGKAFEIFEQMEENAIELIPLIDEFIEESKNHYEAFKKEEDFKRVQQKQKSYP